MRKIFLTIIALSSLALLNNVNANTNSEAKVIAVPMNLVDEHGVNNNIGDVKITSSKYGIVFTPNLQNLPSGLHGFHIHEKPTCAAKEKDGKISAAEAAGEHYDPRKTKKHAEPWGDGHLGDLPALYVDEKGKATNPVLAPRLKISDIHNRTLMVHVNGDNHTDNPPTGGGAERIACGIIK
jgi:superoxide dismutase, Cu-Zn family